MVAFLKKNMTPKEACDDLLNLHYIENYQSFASFDINGAKKNAVTTVKQIIRFFRDLHSKLVGQGLLNGDVEDTVTYKHWMNVIEEINKYTINDIT